MLETSNERQFRFGLPGPSLSEKEWNHFLEVIKQQAREADYIVASGSLPPGVPDDFYARVARIAKDAQTRFVLDASGDPLKEALDEGIFLIKPNIVELSDALGHDIEGEENQENGVREMVESGQAQAAVLSLGAGGVVFRNADSSGRIHAPSIRRRSSVGAGDSMVGGLVLALSRGERFPMAVHFAVAAGSAAVMSPGTELCKREDTEKLFQRLRQSI